MVLGEDIVMIAQGIPQIPPHRAVDDVGCKVAPVE
jgi:hypothetical protein